MLKTYFTIAWRAIVKNKISSVINIGGLSIGLATGVMVLLVVVEEFGYDRFHANLKDIYLVMRNQNLEGRITTERVTPGPLATSLRNEIPEVMRAARLAPTGPQLLRAGEKTLKETAIYADPSLLEIMSFPAVSGNPAAALLETGSVVITESTAKKLFDGQDPMGKILVHDNRNALKVGAVIKDIPTNSSYQFNIVLPFRLYERQNEWVNSKWDDNRILTWIQVKPHTDLTAMNAKLKALFLTKQHEKNLELFAYPFERLRLYGQFKNGKPDGGMIDVIMILGIIGMFVLLIACINFMNLATARYQHRAREVGVRKVLGASRRRIILQFLGEALLISLLALFLAVVLANAALPALMNLAGKNYQPDFWDWRIWALIIALGIFTGVAAGSYPAFYLSRFQPVKVLRKTIHPEGRGAILRRALVTFQFATSIFLIIATIVIFKQVEHVQNRPIGYEPDNLVDIAATGDIGQKFDLIRTQLLQIPGVTHVSAGNDNLIRFNASMNGVNWPGKKPDQDFNITVANVQYDWVSTLGLKLVEGRDFNRQYGTDTLACLINEAAAKRMDLRAPVAGIRLNDHTVVGVLQDFVFNNPADSPKPLIVYLDKRSLAHLFVRLSNDDNWRERIAGIENVVKQANPGYPFEFRFVKDEYQRSFDTARSVAKLANSFGGMAILISCLGLFGLSAFLTERRSKEMSIRKVLGAGMGRIWFTLSRDFLKPVLIAFVLAAPLAGWVMQQVLFKMDYHIQLSWWMFVIAGLAALFIAIATVSYHGVKAALENPARALAAE